MKLRYPIIFLGILAISAPAYAQVANPCDASTTIRVRLVDRNKEQRVQQAFANSGYGSIHVCFDFSDLPDGFLEVSAPLNINVSNPNTTELTIHNLQLRPKVGTTITTPLLHITSDVKVSLRNTTITGATHGIRLQGNAPHEVIGGEVACAPTTQGIGVDTHQTEHL